jgi:DNA modification methylase
MKKPVTPLSDLLDSVRNIEGFPIGKDEDILALSDPPYYTACPNPYLNSFIEENSNSYNEETDDYHREPFVGDVSEGKSDPIYQAHTYHTKVPHKAIMKYIKHYTNPGDIVLDSFCGTGMTGVAARLTNRYAIISDLSPVATFIAYNYNKFIDKESFQNESKKILNEVKDECGWMYETTHVFRKNNKLGVTKGVIHYTVWSDVLICPYCEEEIVLWNTQAKNTSGKDITCSSCSANFGKNSAKKVKSTFYDHFVGDHVTQVKQVPVLISYTVEGKKLKKQPDADDLNTIKKIDAIEIPYWFPSGLMMNIGRCWGDSWRAGIHQGISNVHHFYTKRNLYFLAVLLHKIDKNLLKNHLKTIITSIAARNIFKGNRFVINKHNPNGRINGPLSGTLYLPSLMVEQNPYELIKYKNKQLLNIFPLEDQNDKVIVSTDSSVNKEIIPDNAIDYIFTDPPFGDNIMYSELNFINEAWLKVTTNNSSEAIVNLAQGKKLSGYTELMLCSFKEYYRVLKPNRWITVEFHNSKSSVWNSIQDSLSKAGFIVANVSILDKKDGTVKQSYSPGAVKNDLVISAYKPKESFQSRFLEYAGEGIESEFVSMHLSHLPAEPSVERTEQMLYSKLLAYYVQRSYTIKYNSGTFYKMLRDNFLEEDGYWFNPGQIGNYREYKRKMRLVNIDDVKSGQMVLFIHDEKSAIVWLHTFLNEPKEFQEVYPSYTKIASISGDNVPDIKELLNKNFVFTNGKYRRPQTEDEKLSVTQKRERELIREFEALLLDAKGSKKRIKECRKQAVIYGFEQCYKNNRFKDILDLAKRLDKDITENDSEITEFIEVAELKVEGF